MLITVVLILYKIVIMLSPVAWFLIGLLVILTDFLKQIWLAIPYYGVCEWGFWWWTLFVFSISCFFSILAALCKHLEKLYAKAENAEEKQDKI